MVGNHHAAVTLHRFDRRTDILFRQVEYADDAGIARVAGNIGVVLGEGVIVDDHPALGIEHRQFSRLHAVGSQCFVERAENLLDQTPIGKVDPHGDSTAARIRKRRGIGENIAVLAVDITNRFVEMGLVGDSARQTVAPLQKISGLDVGKPPGAGEGSIIKFFGRQLFAFGVDRVDSQHVAVERYQHHQLVDAIAGSIAVHGLDQRVAV